MPGIVAGNAGQRYACKCLNVRVEASLPQTAPPESVVDPAYTQVYVGDEGISVLTLRSRTRVAPIPETNRYSRFTTLTCLSCDLTVYRVFQIVPADVEGKDGPILPAEDYVEKETMKSPNGWIEVHKDALNGDAIIHAEASTTRSSLFHVLVPAMSSAPVKTLPQVKDSREVSPSPEPTSYLSHIRPLFPPPPFTPSHPAFQHLASIAEKETQARREAAEKHIADLVQRKTEEIERGDAALRQEVESFWRKYKECVKKAHGDHHHHHHHGSLSMVSRSSRSRERDAQKAPFALSSSPSYGTPIAVRDFVPVSVPARRNISPPARPSGLSASLVTTTFHHPRARQASPAGGHGSPDSGSSRTLSTRSGSETLVQPTHTNGVNVLQFRRNINDTINTQASYRYFLNVEEEMARDKKRREELAKAQGQTSTDAQETGSSTQAKSDTPKANGKQKEGSPSAAKAEAQPSKEGDKPLTEEPTTPSRGRDPKGKRKVTFDDVVTISETDAEGAAQANSTDQPDTKDMIFDMEDTEGGDKTSSPQLAPALPLLEQPTVNRPLRPGKAKPKSNGLSQSFAGLRPASLPNPSYIRPRSQPGADASHAMRLSLPRGGPNSLTGGGSKVNGTKSPTGEDESNDEGIRRLVAADTPSHRGAWSTDGRIWQDFTRGHNITSNVIVEESENDNDEVETGANSTAENAPTTNGQRSSSQQVSPLAEMRYEDEGNDQEDETSYDATAFGVPGSLPVHIQMRTKPREVLSLASYAAQNAMPQQEPQPQPAGPDGNHHKALSSGAIRRAMYAERDRERSIDPGPLDFAVPEEDEEDEDEESETEEEKAQIQALLSNSRARKRALKILQAAQQLPEAGMWRSLAS
ncbi:hypothetical protein MD484_g2930, partial [Candolleomyces efflorescens]